MPYRRGRRGLSLRPVNRIKHVFDVQAGMTLGTILTDNLAIATDTPTLAASDSVETGCTINGIYLNVEASMTSGTALANFYMIIAKNPGGNITLPAPNVVGTNDNKRFVIHQEMRMMQIFDADVASNPRSIFNGVIVIPKGYRRFAPNDILQIALLSPGGNANVCIQCHYKEFR